MKMFQKRVEASAFYPFFSVSLWIFALKVGSTYVATKKLMEWMTKPMKKVAVRIGVTLLPEGVLHSWCGIKVITA